LLVSVITPCLNPGDWLERCLDTVSAQTYPYVEHVVVDGGSTDGTVKLLQSRGLQFVSEPDAGQASAINKGFRLARGTLLGWLNADDVLMPRAIEACVAAVRANPAVGWVYGGCTVRRDGAPDFPFRPPKRIETTTFDVGCPVPQPGSLIARWALEQVGGLDESFHLAMDYDLWLRLVDAGIPSTYIPEALAEFEIHTSSKTGSASRSEFLREESQALLKSGRDRQAAFALGRAIAVEASTAVSDKQRYPKLAVDRLTDGVREARPELDPIAVEAGVRSEAAVIEFRRTPLGIRHLMALDIWRYRETRRRMADGAYWGLRVWARRAATTLRRSS
jgi:hypothetical protein